MSIAEVEAAPLVASVGFTTADVSQPSVNSLGAFRMIADGRDSVSDISLPVRVVAD